jgi:hypothetical protein
MSRKIRDHIRSNVVGYVAVFIALSGTAYAVDGPLPGVDQVGSEDIINTEVKGIDLAPNAVGPSRIADGAVEAPEIAENAIVDDTLNPITGSTKIDTGAIKESELGNSSVFSGEVAPGALNGSDIEDGSLGGADIADSSVQAADIATNAVGTSEVAPNSLTTNDVAESTLVGLDGHADYNGLGCDPSAEVYVNCGSLRFTAGRAMQVLTTYTYGFSTTNGDPFGDCVTTVDGVHTSITVSHSDAHTLGTGAIPVVDVISVDPGSHTLGLICEEIDPDDHDIEYKEVRITATELAMD